MEFAAAAWSALVSFWNANAGEFTAALGGAFFGAWAAYALQQWSEKRKESDERHGAILQAQLALVTKLNTLRNIQTQWLNKFRTDQHRVYKMWRFYQAGSTLEIDFKSLAFLLDGEQASFLAELHVVDRCYKTAMDALEVRNKEYERLRDRSQVVDANMETGEFGIHADPRDVKMLKDATDSLFKSVDDAEKKCAQAIKDLKAAGKKVFPGRKFLKEIDEASKPPSATA
jgi:hypothetical protein